MVATVNESFRRAELSAIVRSLFAETVVPVVLKVQLASYPANGREPSLFQDYYIHFIKARPIALRQINKGAEKVFSKLWSTACAPRLTAEFWNQ